MNQLGSAQRGLLVVAHLASHQEVVAALKIAQALRWPVVADALSGIACATFWLLVKQSEASVMCKPDSNEGASRPEAAA